MSYFLEKLQKIYSKNLFTEDDVKIIFFDSKSNDLNNQLSYYLKTKKITKFKRGLYCLTPPEDFFSFSRLELANMLYQPSYISFESALAIHQLIPEAVRETTSACFQNKKKIYTNLIGNFSFQHVPVSPFFLDVSSFHQYNLANPLRALLDLVYVRRIRYNEFADVEADLRIESDKLAEYLENYTASHILKLSALYKKKNVSVFANILIERFK